MGDEQSRPPFNPPSCQGYGGTGKQPAVAFLSVEPLLEELGDVDLLGIDWVIVGGESGPRARPMLPDWVRSIRSQCKTQGVAFFFKQWGGVRKASTGRELDGRTYDEFPELGKVALEMPAKPRREPHLLA